jgi:hypothetical protein
MDANDPIRRRIVINLDSPSGAVPRGRPDASRAPGRSRRWPKVIAIILVLLFVVVLASVIGGYFWWRHYQSTPSYAIALIVDAAQRNDMASFEKQIDDEAIARNMISDVSQKAATRYGLALNGTLQKQIDTLVPTLLPRLKDSIHQEVAKEIKELASKSEPKPFILVALAVPTLVTIASEGDKATAAAQLPNRKIELGLERTSDLWKVTAFKDDVLLQHVVDNVMKDLPAIGGVDSSLLKSLQKPKKK